MVRFKCGQCGAAQEAPSDLAGTAQKCPRCGAVNKVPTGASPPNAIAASPKLGIARPVGNIVGIVLVCLGLTVMVLSLGSSASLDGKVANLDKMNLRLCGVVAGTGFFLAGVVLVAVTGLHVSLLKIAKLNLRR